MQIFTFEGIITLNTAKPILNKRFLIDFIHTQIFDFYIQSRIFKAIKKIIFHIKLKEY